MANLEHLLQEIKIKSMLLKNRVVMPPMGTGLGQRDGTVSEATLAYFKRRVKSGAGLYITEISSVHTQGSVSPSALRIYDDSYITGLSQLVKIAHKEDAKIAIQLHHAGRESFYQLKRGEAMAPSAIASYVFGGSPKAMRREDIEEVIQAFGSAARRAVEAGFDAVELHAAHGYLLHQFLSIHSNQREDEYGGNMQNRARFILECIQAVRAQVGQDFPISLRISAEEVIKNGYSIEEMQEIAPKFVKAGVDIIHASFGTHGSPGGIIQAPIEYAQGFNVHLARKIKEKVEIPVIGVGRFTDPVIMNEVIKRGDADLIAVGRQHLADPDFLNNAIAGHPERTFQCLACNQGCIERLIYEGKSVRCAINPETGQELYYPSQPAAEKRQVWIIGGGPAGLTAAAEAARLGHQVTLLEKEKQLGGQVIIAAQAPYKGAYADWIDQLKDRALRYGARIKTGIEVSESMIVEGKPEVLILASGAKQIIPSLEGIEMPSVIDAWSILKGEKAVGKNVVVVGGGLTGMETADYLIQHGVKSLVLVDQLPKSPINPLTAHGNMLNYRLKKAKGQFMFNTQLSRIKQNSVELIQDGQNHLLSPVDQVVIAIGAQAQNSLEPFLAQSGIDYYVVGDAAEPRRIIEAVEEGARAAWNISG
ncbi:MAG: FAD-dependent oxidoreductase [Syntrophomonadaceae bacterium]|jgi:2,4-dienoyl-CoA reductase-like NADH-dependent reductase (Old Yellow Enzyme family)/thioredoxin reductase|nr:FAD-dependent oxidoreductase [Syntrophomonadaceae bacterium]